MKARDWGVAAGIQLQVPGSLPTVDHHWQHVVSIYVNGKFFDVTVLGLPEGTKLDQERLYDEVLCFLHDFFHEGATPEDYPDYDDEDLEKYLWAKRFIGMLDKQDADDFVMGVIDFRS